MRKKNKTAPRTNGTTMNSKSNAAKDFLTPHWVLECDSCKAEIIRSKISESDLREIFPPKPDIPAGGALQCPSCGKTGTYQRTDFVYRI